MRKYQRSELCDTVWGQSRTPLQTHEFPMSVLFTLTPSIRDIIQRWASLTIESSCSVYGVIMGTIMVFCRDILSDISLIPFGWYKNYTESYLVNAISEETGVQDKTFVRTILFELASTELIEYKNGVFSSPYILELCDVNSAYNAETETETEGESESECEQESIEDGEKILELF